MLCLERQQSLERLGKGFIIVPHVSRVFFIVLDILYKSSESLAIVILQLSSLLDLKVLLLEEQFTCDAFDLLLICVVDMAVSFCLISAIFNKAHVFIRLFTSRDSPTAQARKFLIKRSI